MAKYVAAKLSQFLSSAYKVHAQAQRADSRGWGDKIEWWVLNTALTKAKLEDKPMMVVVHKLTCPACQFQKRWFASSGAIQSLSKKFVMVNLEIHEVPRGDAEYAPDGHYVPRIMFFTPNGRLMSHVKMNSNEFRYNYPGESFLIRNMKMVAKEPPE